MASNTLESLQKLEKHERAVVDQIGDPSAGLEDLEYEDMLKTVSDLARMVFASGTDDFKPETSVWGAGGTNVPLPILLTIQGGPIVDVSPIPEDVLISRSGVNAEQLQILGEKGLVNLNLYADSELEKKVPAYAAFDHLNHVIDPEVTGCRVHGIRRRKLFDLIGFDNKAQTDLIERLSGKFLPRFRKYDLDELNKMLGGALVEDAEGGAVKLAHNMMYLAVLGTVDDKSFIDQLDGEEWPFDLEVILEHVRYRKSYLCSPITASFGGTHNYSNENYDPALYASSIQPEPRVRKIDRYRKKLAEFSVLLARQRHRVPVQPKPLHEKLMFTDRADFNNFVAFVSDKRPVLDRADVVLRHMLNLAPNEIEFERLITELSDLAYDIEKDAARGFMNEYGVPLATTFVSSFLGAKIGDAVDARYGQYVEALGPKGKDRRRFILIGLGGALGAAVGATAGKALDDAIAELAFIEPPKDVQFSRRVVAEYVSDIRYR